MKKILLGAIMVLLLATMVNATMWVSSSVHGELYNMNDDGSVNFVMRELDNPRTVVLDNDGNAMVLVAENKELLVIRPDGLVKTHIGPLTVYDPAFTWPLDVVSDSEGNIWVADASAIVKLDEFGQVIFKISGVNSVDFPRHVEYSAYDDTIIVAGREELVKYTTKGKPLYRITGLNHPKDLAIHHASGTYAVADTENSAVKVYAADGQEIRTLTIGVRLPFSVDFSNDGTLWIINTLDRKIMQYDQYGQRVGEHIINSEIGVPTKIYIDQNTNDLFVIDKEQLWHIKPDGKVRLSLTFDQPLSDIAADFGAKSAFDIYPPVAPALPASPYDEPVSAPKAATEVMGVNEPVAREGEAQETMPVETEDAEMEEEVEQLRQQVADQREAMNDLMTQQSTKQRKEGGKDNSEIVAVLVVTFLILLVLAFLGGMMLRKKQD